MANILLSPTEKQLSQVKAFFANNLDIPYGSASTGMKAKLGLSLIFMKEWEIILIDEAMSTIDAESMEMLAEILVRRAKKTAIIYVSHSGINELLDAASTIIELKKGELLWKKKA